LLGRRAEARLARAGELAAHARRDARDASDQLEAARCLLSRLDREIACRRKALANRLAQRASSARLMNRNDFARHEYAHTQLMACRLDACAAMDAAKTRLDATLAALAEAEAAQRKCLRQREKYRLAEQLSVGKEIEDAGGPSFPAMSTMSVIPSMWVP